MRHLMAAPLLMLALTTGQAVPASAEQSPALAGDYVMRGKGFGPNDSAYEGTCSLYGDGPVYEVSCFNQATRHTYVGRGLAIDDIFSITIGDVLHGDHGSMFTGEYLVVYKRKANGLLEGTWTETRGSAAGSETLTPIR